uniref:Sperm acrosome membrane-associated protein 3 n=1 Tax=Terrapene triunguis TaxID=2587831 RepID=A0A674K2X8_9SAUR
RRKIDSLMLLSILACVLVGNMGKIFRRCELAQVLHQAGMDGFRGYSLADWLCMAFHESRFNTDTVDHEADGSTDNGIFQINSRQWCDDYRSSTRNLCHMHCSDLLTSNINDDIVCAMQIVQQPRGMGCQCSSAWQNMQHSVTWHYTANPALQHATWNCTAQSCTALHRFIQLYTMYCYNMELHIAT